MKIWVEHDVADQPSSCLYADGTLRRNGGYEDGV